jgi:putative redox protein
MQAKVQWMGGLTFAGKADSGHWTVMDTEESVGGADGASKPLELVLMGLGGCTGMDVASILQKMRVPLDRFEIALSADRSEEHPKVFTRITVEYRLWGADVPAEKVERAIELSRTSYCSVSAMLSKAASLEFKYRINPNP